MTEIYLHFLFVHYGLYGNAPLVARLLVLLLLAVVLDIVLRVLSVSPASMFQLLVSRSRVYQNLYLRGFRAGCERNVQLPECDRPYGVSALPRSADAHGVLAVLVRRPRRKRRC